jgi:hypothetical protein
VVFGGCTVSICIPIAVERVAAVYPKSVDITESWTLCSGVLIVESTTTLPAEIDISMSETLTPERTEASPCAYPLWLNVSIDPATVDVKLTAGM